MMGKKAKYLRKCKTDDNVWSSDCEPKQVVEECGFGDGVVKPIVICDDVVKVIKQMCREVKTEWQMLLVGIDGEEAVEVTGYYIPKQSVTGGSVENLEPINMELINKLGIVAGIHSHSNMEVFFSDEDKKMNMGDIKYNVVVNNKGEVKAVGQIELPCGSYYMAETTVIMGGDENVEIVGLDKVEKVSYGLDIYRGKKYYNNYSPTTFHNDLFDEYDCRSTVETIEQREIDRTLFC